MSTSTTPVQSTIDKIREMFKAGRILTSCGAAEAYETADLRKIISVLRGKGMDIVDRWKKSSTGKKHKEYFLREFTPKEIAPVTPVSPAPAPSDIINPDPASCTCPDDVPLALLHAAYPPEKQQQTLFE